MKFILIYLLVLNLLGFSTMGVDKAKAKMSAWRIPEKILLAIAFLGGALGSWVGMAVFHHKTRHKKFTFLIPMFLFTQILLLIFGVYAFWPI